MGFIGYFLSVGSQLIEIKLSSASVASLVNSMNPITITVFAAIMLKERLTIRKVICVILAVIGVYIIIGGLKGNGQVLGTVFSILSVISWSFVSVIVKKVTQKYTAIQVTTYCMFVVTACTLPCSAYELVTTHNVQFHCTAIVSLLYMGLVCTALAYILWNKSLSMIEAGTCSLFYPVQPMVSVLLGCMFLGEKIDIKFIFGAILIIGGVLFSILEKNEVSISTSL
jgi:drug/metabolite transporter (DMT)-like permease